VGLKEDFCFLVDEGEAFVRSKLRWSLLTEGRVGGECTPVHDPSKNEASFARGQKDPSG